MRARTRATLVQAGLLTAAGMGLVIATTPHQPPPAAPAVADPGPGPLGHDLLTEAATSAATNPFVAAAQASHQAKLARITAGVENPKNITAADRAELAARGVTVPKAAPVAKTASRTEHTRVTTATGTVIVTTVTTTTAGVPTVTATAAPAPTQTRKEADLQDALAHPATPPDVYAAELAARLKGIPVPCPNGATTGRRLMSGAIVGCY